MTSNPSNETAENEDQQEEQESLNVYQRGIQAHDDKPIDARIYHGILELLKPELKQLSSNFRIQKELKEAAAALVDVAEDTGDPEGILQFLYENLSQLAEQTQIKKEKVRDGLINDEFDELHVEQIQQAIDDGELDILELDQGIAVDQYIEENLVKVVRTEVTDQHQTSRYSFHFKQGVVECSDSEYLSFGDFYPELQSLGPAVRKEIVSLNLTKTRSEGGLEIPKTSEKYAKLSWGPEERPWGFDTKEHKMWNQCVTHLTNPESDACHVERTTGPRTEAWTNLQHMIATGQAALDKRSAAEHEKMHVNRDKEEIWIPTSMVDSACEDIACERVNLAFELAGRGCPSDELSGDKVSFKDHDFNPAVRWWRLDLSHAEVPCPDEDNIVPNFTHGAAATAGTGDTAVADGGEVFGGDDTDSDDDEDNEGGE